MSTESVLTKKPVSIPEIKEIKSSVVLNKINTILVCSFIQGTETKKTGRSGEKYLATNILNPTLAAKLQSGIKYKATGKVDGTCCIVKNGVLHKRRDIKPKREIPPNWIQTGEESDSGHLIGFMPLEKGDKWHIDCHLQTTTATTTTYDMTKINILDPNESKKSLVYKQIDLSTLNDTSVEVMGPKFQANPHHLKMHCIMRHGIIELTSFPDLLSLDTIKNWFLTSAQGQYLEGVVLHLEDGSMYKIHRHHLDLKWSPDDILPLDQISL